MSAPEMSSSPTELSLDEEPLIMVVYGEFGRGKTTLASTFPKPLFVDTNRGMVTLAMQGKKPMRFEPTGHEDLEALYFWIKDQVDGGDYETIVIDSMDSLVFILMDEITDDAVSEKQAQGKKVSLRMQFIPEQGDYFANQRQTNRFLTALRRLGKHIVILSSHRFKNGRSAPNVSDGMEKVICDFASVIGEIVILDEVDDEDKKEDPELYDGCRVMFTQESNARATKSRFRSLKPYVVLPEPPESGFDKVWALITAEYAEAQKTATPTRRRRASAKR